MENTIVAISTNNIGVGAINIIRVSGENAIEIVSKIFTNKNFKDAKSHTIHYGFIKDQEEIIDEVLVMLMRAPKTYTMEDVVEINCHGGYITTNKIYELLLKYGANAAEPGEFTKRAFLNGRINLMEAESISDLIEAKTEKASNLALNGLRGKTTKIISSLREKMVTLLANIEVNIDYPEYQDELQITKTNITPVLTNIKEELLNIIDESQNSKIIKNGINIAIIGRPNVGKSSILNAILEENKAIVTDISGTTRDIVEGSVVYNGIALNFIDTAGIRETEDIVEKIGVEKSREVQKKADITILVLNNNEKIAEEDIELIESIKSQKAIVFVNKTDLPCKLNRGELPYEIMKGSTKNGEGIEELKKKILDMFAVSDLANKDLAYLSNSRQIGLARRALKNIEHVIEENQNNVPVDMLSIEIKEAWEELGKLIGESYEDELVDNIFSRFCLGK